MLETFDPGELRDLLDARLTARLTDGTLRRERRVETRRALAEARQHGLRRRHNNKENRS